MCEEHNKALEKTTAYQNILQLKDQLWKAVEERVTEQIQTIFVIWNVYTPIRWVLAVVTTMSVKNLRLAGSERVGWFIR